MTAKYSDVATTTPKTLLSTLVEVRNLPMRLMNPKTERGDISVGGCGYIRQCIEALLKITEDQAYAWRVLATISRCDAGIEHVWSHEDCERALAMLDGATLGKADVPAANPVEVLPDETPPPEFSPAYWDAVENSRREGDPYAGALLQLRGVVEWLMRREK